MRVSGIPRFSGTRVVVLVSVIVTAMCFSDNVAHSAEPRCFREICFFGGEVVESPASLFVIFQHPPGSYEPPAFESTITGFLVDLSGSAPMKILSQYGDDSG